MTATPVVIDCDPGHDDAMAIILAAAHPGIDLKAITTVAGNQSLEKTTLNARRVASLIGLDDVPISSGASGPLHGVLRTAPEVHGQSGLDGPTFACPTVPEAKPSAIDLLSGVLQSSPDPMTVIALGPLTNIAALLAARPECKRQIKEIVLMGGSTERGNITPYAEFNIFVDPEAADIVFSSGLPVTMCGLNVTHQALVTEDVIQRISALATPLAETCVELLTFFSGTYRQVWGFAAPPLHDPVAVARVIDPAIVSTVRVPVAIEMAGTHTRGATSVDLHHLTGMPDNADVATTLDTARFWDLVIDAIRTLGS